MPVDGGVLEYGMPATLSLDSNLLEATLKLRVDTSGAGYSLYWKETNGQFTVAGSYLPAARELALVKKGRTGKSYAQASENITLDASGDGPVSRCYKSQEPIFIRDASGAKLKRAGLVKAFGIASIVFSFAEGGVIECGTSLGPETADWKTFDDANIDAIPCGELRRAFAEGANELIYWRRVGDKYAVRGDYIIPERLRSLRQARGDEESYTSRTEEQYSLLIDAYGSGPIASAQRSGVEVVIENAATAKKFKRKQLALEFGVSNVHFVPLAGAVVLEYGRGGAASEPPEGIEEQHAAPGKEVPTSSPPSAATESEAEEPVLASAQMAQAMALSYATDKQYERVRSLNRYAQLDLSLRRAQDDIRTLREAGQVSRRATLIAPLATISAISLAQYVARPDFDFPGLDLIKEAVRRQYIRAAEPAAEVSTDLYFPGNIGSGRMDHLLDRTLKKRGFTAQNTLFATSVCPDEVNSKIGELADLLTTRYGEGFALGGLGGIPFTGKAGFTAYSHHAPDNLPSGGKMFILFAPHVGIQDDGTVGKLKRSSQKGVSTACGAAVGAYNAVKKEAEAALEEGEGKGSDAQIDFIKKRLSRGIKGIEDAPDPIAFVTYQMYCIMREFFVLDLKTAPGIWDYANELTVLGGIQINRDKGGDRFMPLMFQTRKKPAGSTVDLFEETFGPKPDLSVVLGEKNIVLRKTFESGSKL